MDIALDLYLATGPMIQTMGVAQEDNGGNVSDSRGWRSGFDVVDYSDAAQDGGMGFPSEDEPNHPYT
ncbi:hypothetical protein E2P81_ATG08019 [Venturia nashicola]|nr:hypothetical protein E2P81_ATG08019 [Venturia nashicola]